MKTIKNTDQYLSSRSRDKTLYDMSESLDDAIDTWHDGPSKLPLHKFLNLTREQYETYVMEPGKFILDMFNKKYEEVYLEIEGGEKVFIKRGQVVELVYTLR